MKTLTVETSTTTRVFNVPSEGYNIMLNNQFRNWDDCQEGSFLMSPQFAINDCGTTKLVNLPPMGKMITDMSGRKCFYCTYRQASSIARIHEQGIEWNRERKFLLVLQEIMDSTITPKTLTDTQGEVLLYKVNTTIKFQRTIGITDSENPELETVQVAAHMEIRVPNYEGGNPSIKILEDASKVNKEVLDKINAMKNKFRQEFDVM